MSLTFGFLNFEEYLKITCSYVMLSCKHLPTICQIALIYSFVHFTTSLTFINMIFPYLKFLHIHQFHSNLTVS